MFSYNKKKTVAGVTHFIQISDIHRIFIQVSDPENHSYMEQIITHLDPQNPCLMGCPKQKINLPPPTPCRACSTKDPDHHCRKCFKNQISFYKNNSRYKDKLVNKTSEILPDTKTKSTKFKNGFSKKSVHSISNKSLSRIPVQSIRQISLSASDSDNTKLYKNTPLRRLSLRNLPSSSEEFTSSSSCSNENDNIVPNTSEESSEIITIENSTDLDNCTSIDESRNTSNDSDGVHITSESYENESEVESPEEVDSTDQESSF